MLWGGYFGVLGVAAFAGVCGNVLVSLVRVMVFGYVVCLVFESYGCDGIVHYAWVLWGCV